MVPRDFFPLGWLERPFRRQPYPDMTYREALDAAEITLWNMRDVPDAQLLTGELVDTLHRMGSEHPEFEGRSQQSVTALNELWRGKVTTLLKWFQTQGGK